MLYSLLKYLLVCTVFAIVLTSCETEMSEDVNQDRIYTDYELFYNANQDITYARATFRFGNVTGTALTLTEPSNVTVNGDAMTFKPLLNFYEKTYSGFRSSASFNWEDTEGKQFENAVTLDTIDYAGTIDTIDRSQSYEVMWTGSPLTSGELIWVWANGENEFDAQVAGSIEQGSGGVILAADKLMNVGVGDGTLVMERRSERPLDEATSAGGKKIGRYRPVNQTPYFE